jgi:CRP/FNR family transcriptional regulator
VEIVPIFSTLSPVELDEVGSITFDKTYAKGEAIYRAGDRKGKLYIVHKGRVRVYRISVDGKEQLVRMVGPGQFIGELSLFSSLATTDYADAAEPSVLCMIDGSRLKQLMGEHPSIALKVMEELSKRLEEAESLIEGINLRTVEQRLARFLLSETERAAEFTLQMSKGDLASRLGMSQETLSRKLAAFEEGGLIELKGQRGIVILDAAALEDISESEEE